ncbi:vWA domain-containing protein [Polycladidibacter hongkongensis]|uniref:vWA domain-containing protein n=1 Tax=Polycladidibacter hongkongensis TaxID=1647556 RepID=UPI00082B30EE|nr:VWA domain-containing protein [Pseudovibrio hongkongensis]
MFIEFFLNLKQKGLPVSLREYLTLMAALDADLADKNPQTFYYLSRATLVKDESNIDKFDQVFAQVFAGQLPVDEVAARTLPTDWLTRLAEKHLSEEDKALIKSMGGFEKLMETLAQRLAQQEERHQGGNKWIGTAGTSPFGAYGYNSEGIRIGQSHSRHRRAVKVWDERAFQDLDGSRELGTRNIKVALKRLRRFARQGAAEEFDLEGTITSTARKAMLDVQMRPERRNAIKVLMLFDIGGSMDDHIRTCEELFSAARSEFKHLDYYYFHNCPYEALWKNNARRHTERFATTDLLHKYGEEYKLIFVGDASMSPYEITYSGGSVEHWNEEPGSLWMQRLTRHFKKSVWLNPVPKQHWRFTPSINILGELMEQRMFPLTLQGLDKAMRDLGK